MNWLALLALEIGDVIGILVGIVFIIIAVAGQLMAKFKEMQKGQQGPRGPQQRKPLEDEIGQFIRDVTGRRAGGQVQQAPQQAPPRAVRPKPRPAQPRQAARAVKPVEVEVVEAERVSLREQLHARKPRQVGSQLAQEVSLADRKMAGHVHEVFDHRLGSLESTLGDSAEAPGVEEPGTPEDQTSPWPLTAAAGLAAIFSNVDSIRQAIIINEVLQRPEHRWS